MNYGIKFVGKIIIRSKIRQSKPAMQVYFVEKRKMTQKQLEDYLWGAANILRGMIDAADFKQYIFPLLFFKRVSDLWDEEFQTALEESDGDLRLC
jgi:hypothetical protein